MRVLGSITIKAESLRWPNRMKNGEIPQKYNFLKNVKFKAIEHLLKAFWNDLADFASRESSFKDVRAHCYCASPVRTLFIRHARATSFSSARTKSKTEQNIELITFALTPCANIFVGCSGTSTFFSADHFLLWFFPLHLKTKKICTWEVLIISHLLFT